MDLFTKVCPDCRSNELKTHTVYMTQNHGQRNVYKCKDCGCCFSETNQTFLFGIKTPLSRIIQVLKDRTEGQGLNAVCRIFNAAKNTVLTCEKRFEIIKQVLMIYALVHSYLQLLIEGDEIYTRVGKNLHPDESLGWTVVLMDRSSRFLWELGCGRKDRKLFRKVIRTLGNLMDRTGDLSLITDGERRYGRILFEICHEFMQTGKKGRSRKTLKK